MAKKKSYRVFYIGDDSLGHAKVVWAKDHDEAAEAVRKATDSDIITGVQRCMNPYLKVGIFVLAALLLLSLLVVSCVRTA